MIKNTRHLFALYLNLFIQKSKWKIWNFIRDYFYENRILTCPVILNLNNDPGIIRKRVLICYLTDGFCRSFKLAPKGRTISDEIFKIVKVFSEYGFVIDIISHSDIRSLEYIAESYSVIFGFGDTFRTMSGNNPDALSVLYMTENHPEISFAAEKTRNDYYYRRHGRKVPLHRSGSFYKKEHLDIKYSHVITLSEEEPLKSQYSKVFTLFPTGLINRNFQFTYKNHAETRFNFLWFGSYGAIHKGLDLLIDVFSNRDDVILHVCGLTKQEKRFLRIRSKHNIVDHGFVDVSSGQYLQIVEKCSFSILPSCSEACSTSITTSMMHGLIPVVMRNAGFDRLGDNAVFFDDYSIEYINSSINKLVDTNPGNLELLSKKIYEYARSTFTLQEFECRFRSIMNEIFHLNG
jgi:hypothetical protein